MIDPQLVGGLLYTVPDPMAVAEELVSVLPASNLDIAAGIELGLDPVLARVVWRARPRDTATVSEACRTGAAWVLGRRSVKREDAWEAVASIPQMTTLPSGLRRKTGETLISMIASAHKDVRIAAPYVDRGGLDVLADAIIAATLRAVNIGVFHPPNWDPADSAIARLTHRLRDEGNETYLHILYLREAAPWTHLKVVTVDGQVAYIGSANMTEAGLLGRNVELGVLVRGSAVTVIDEVLDAFIG